MQTELRNAFFFSAGPDTLLDGTADGVKWVEAIAPKTYVTPVYGDVVVSHEKIDRFVHNLNNNVRGQDVAIDYEHGLDPVKGKKAAGWIRGARKNANGNLELAVDFTETAKDEIGKKEWKYFSLEWDDEWLHPDGKKIQDVIMGGGLTNRPVAKGLMPINFSELFTETLEVKELEHSEPGTGSPPEPRTDGDGHDDADRKGGWRVNTPPIADDPTDAVVIKFNESEAIGYLTSAKLGLERIHTNAGNALIDEIDSMLNKDYRTRSFNELQALVSKTRSVLRDGKDTKTDDPLKGGNTVGELTEKDLRELRMVLDVDDDGKILESVKVKFGELAGLRDAVSASEQERVFAEQYPQFYQEHVKLMERDRRNGAKAFAESVKAVRKAEGFGLKTTKLGLSTAATEKITDLHMKFSENKGTVSDFEEALKIIMNGGLVQFGEIGSSGEEALPEVDASSAPGVANARKVFAEAVDRVRRDNPDMPYLEAIAEASKKHPDLADTYKITLPA